MEILNWLSEYWFLPILFYLVYLIGFGVGTYNGYEEAKKEQKSIDNGFTKLWIELYGA